MSGDEVAVRYASPRYVDNDLVDGAAFKLRSSDAGELSVNLLGPDEKTHPARLQEIRKLSRLCLKRNGRFAQISATDIRQSLVEISYLQNLDVIHDPLVSTGSFPADPSHAAIMHLPPPESEFASLAGDLLAERISKVHPALAD